jgi:Ser/Thr protein kinase RdoA (MazF antagonist)
MSLFDSLTYEEQVARFADAAEQVLPHFGFSHFDVTPLSYAGNAVFAVDSRRGPYVLRIHSPQHPPPVQINSEMCWLADLYAQTPLCVPQPLAVEEGVWLAWAEVNGLPDALPCVVLSWLEGVTVPIEHMTPALAIQVGNFLARLHLFSLQYRPPPDFERPSLDWEGLFGADSLYDPGEDSHILTSDLIAVMDTVAGRVRSAMQALDIDETSFGLIHGDFIHKNYFFQDAQVCAVDFEYCAFGYYLYDLAPVLLGWSPLPTYESLKVALWQGYTALRPQPEAYRDLLEIFVAGRHAASCRWIASNLHNPRIRARAPEILASRGDELRAFLDTGRLERKSDIF